jgi:hypothetical protein
MIISYMIIKHNIFYNNKYLYIIIYNLQYNYDIFKYNINLNFIFENIKYISIITKFKDFLEFILIKYKKYFINNINNNFINILYVNEEYLELLKSFNIIILNLKEITPYDEYNINDIKKEYNLKFNKYHIIYF